MQKCYIKTPELKKAIRVTQEEYNKIYKYAKNSGHLISHSPTFGRLYMVIDFNL